MGDSRYTNWKLRAREAIANAGPWGMAATGFVVRVAVILIQHSYRFRTSEQNFAFGFEIGRIAQALALGQGFSSPFHGVTGPTAWESPVYPLLVAGVFRVSGIYTPLSAFLILVLNSAFSALTAVPVFLIAKKLFGMRLAKWSGWTWALLPYAMNWAVRWVWETSLTAMLLATAFWLTLEIAESHGRRLMKLWLLYGLLWGAIALIGSSSLSFLPFAGGWACYRLWRQRRPWFLPAVASALVFLAVITPWEARNYRVFGQFVPLRGNFGVELRLGNGPEARGICLIELHPTWNLPQYRLYQQMGEVEYARMRKASALEWMQAHPGATAGLLGKKVFFYWAGVPYASGRGVLSQLRNGPFVAWSALAWWGLGLMLWRRKRGVFLFASLLLVYPAVYYVAFPQLRYRHPIEPLMLILALYVISQTRELRDRAVDDSATGSTGINAEPCALPQ